MREIVAAVVGLYFFIVPASPALAQDLEIAVRPEAIYVESIAGNIVPMERVFFHIIVHNNSGNPIDLSWVRFDVVNGDGILFSGQYSGKALVELFDSAIDRKRIEPTAKGTLTLGPDERKAMSDIFLDFPKGFIGESMVVEVDYNEIQRSPTYPSGFALRFARIARIRPDKAPGQATTLEELRGLYERQFATKGRAGP